MRLFLFCFIFRLFFIRLYLLITGTTFIGPPPGDSTLCKNRMASSASNFIYYLMLIIVRNGRKIDGNVFKDHQESCKLYLAFLL